MEGGDVWRWVLEFLLYQNRNPRVPTNLIKNLLLIIPASDFDSTLKKTLLLRTLQDHVYTVSLPESILETLELLEELHRRDGSPISAAMSAAYCAVAVECTLKYLLVELCNNPTFIGAVNRIWLGRVWHMNNCSEEGRRSLLLSPELERWRRDIETSLWDLQMRERLASIDTRRHAVVKLKAYLDEAWANLGPSFLEIVAALMRMNNALAANHSEAQHHEREIQECTAAAEEGHSSKTVEVQKVAECNLEVNEEAPIESRDEDVPCPHFINNNEADLMEEDQTEIQNCTAAVKEAHSSTTVEVQKVTECDDSVELQTLAKDSLLNSLEVNEEEAIESRDEDVPCPHVINNNEAHLMEEDQTEIQKCTAAAEEVHPSTTVEIQKVVECDDSVELQKLAKDSLLNSLEVNEEEPIESRDEDVPCPHVINNNEADLMEKDQTEIQKCTTAAAEEVHPSTTVEVQKVAECDDSVELQKLAKDSLLNSLEVNEEAPIESRDEDVPCPHVINNNEAHLMEKDQISVTVPHNDDHRPSLMERNSTARVYEWDDSIDGLEDGTSSHASRFHLPSPKERKLSPLKMYKPASITKRRKPKKWSQLEEETLKTAVDKFGRGNWKLILDSHKDIFEERTEVDLKDKWRNMTR